MDFVESIKVGDVESMQIPCLTRKGAPSVHTEGGVGCLYMNTDNGDMYKCTDVNDGVYTWVPMSNTYFGTPYTAATEIIDISAAGDGSVKLYLFSNGNGKYDGVVRGTGAMMDYAVTDYVIQGDIVLEGEDNRPYPAKQISRLHIEAGVTSIGAYFMYGGYSLQNLSFADSTAITHLSAYAFANTLIDGEYDFSGLTDSIIDCVFSGCAKLKGLTLSNSIKKIPGRAFVSCFNLKYIYGLTGLESISYDGVPDDGDRENDDFGAFGNCVSLEELDVIPENVVLYATAFYRVQCAAKVRATRIPLCEAKWKTGSSDDAFVQNLWTSEQLEDVRAATGKSITLPIPVCDAQMDFFNRTWKLLWFPVDENGVITVYHDEPDISGCAYFSVLHAYNSIHPEAPYARLYDFVHNLILPRKITVTQEMHDYIMNDPYGQKLVETNKDVSYKVGQQITAFDLPHVYSDIRAGGQYTALWGVFKALGWDYTPVEYPTASMKQLKEAAIDSLNHNKPFLLTVHSGYKNGITGHEVSVIGYNADTDKFLIVETGGRYPPRHCDPIFWAALETVTTPTERISAVTLDFGEVISMTHIDEKLDEVLFGMSFRKKTGSFTPNTDITSINLEIEPGAKLVIIKSVTEPKTRPESDWNVPVLSWVGGEDFTGFYPKFPTAGAMMVSGYGGEYWMSFPEYDTSNGFSLSYPETDYTVFEGGMTYEWEALWWDNGSSLPPEQVVVNDELVMD